jgi:hypothetical protein
MRVVQPSTRFPPPRRPSPETWSERYVKAAQASGWSLQEMDEGLIDHAWRRKKPKWEVYVGLPISFVMVWRRRPTEA